MQPPWDLATAQASPRTKAIMSRKDFFDRQPWLFKPGASENMASTNGALMETTAVPSAEAVRPGKPPVVAVLHDYANVNNVPVVGVVLPKESLGRKHAMKLRKALAGKQYESLTVVVLSGGGDIHAAYLIMSVLRMHAKKITVLVPFHAKSAATLLCLGADQIAMDELAELGPLDTQMGEVEGGELRFRSSLTSFKTLEQLRNFSLETLDLSMKMIVQRCQLAPAEALSHASQLVAAITNPLFQQMNPEDLGESSRALLIGMEYGERLLRRHSKLPKDKQEALLHRLVYQYPAHDFVVDHHEAKELELPVRLFNDQERTFASAFAASIGTTNEVIFIEPTVATKPEPALAPEPTEKTP